MSEGLPERDEQFDAAELGSGHHALNPPFRCTRVDKGNVYAIDSAGSLRIFDRNVWGFSLVERDAE